MTVINKLAITTLALISTSLVSLPESLVSYQKTHFDPGELVHILTA